MTTTQLNAANKAALINYINELKASEEAYKKDVVNAVNIANYFASVIADIEKLLLNSPFVNKEGKFFKKLFWVMANFETIKTIIELIIEKIKNWRETFNKLAEQNKPQA